MTVSGDPDPAGRDRIQPPSWSGSPFRTAHTWRPTSVLKVLHWLRSVLDRPLTSYHLVLGSVALLVIVGLMMVLSASSVNAYLRVGDSTST